MIMPGDLILVQKNSETSIGIITQIFNFYSRTSSDKVKIGRPEENIDFWLPIICDLVNTSLKTESMDGAKLPHLTRAPLFKDNHYRQISNISFIG